MGIEGKFKEEEKKRRQERFERLNDELVGCMEMSMEIGHEKYGDSWLNVDDPDYFFRRMEEELYELRQAVEHDVDEEEALKELSDIGNFGKMFISASLSQIGSQI